MSDQFQLDLKVLQWRDMIRKGQGADISSEDMRQALNILRGDRSAAQQGKEASAKNTASKKEKGAKDASALLDEFKKQMGSGNGQS